MGGRSYVGYPVGCIEEGDSEEEDTAGLMEASGLDAALGADGIFTGAAGLSRLGFA